MLKSVKYQFISWSPGGQRYIAGEVQTMTKSNPFIKQLISLNYLKILG